MKITFNITRRISEDGHTTRLCEAGKSYDIADTAARVAINAGHATKDELKGFDDSLAEMLAELRNARNKRKSA